MRVAKLAQMLHRAEYNFPLNGQKTRTRHGNCNWCLILQLRVCAWIWQVRRYIRSSPTEYDRSHGWSKAWWSRGVEHRANPKPNAQLRLSDLDDYHQLAGTETVTGQVRGRKEI